MHNTPNGQTTPAPPSGRSAQGPFDSSSPPQDIAKLASAPSMSGKRILKQLETILAKPRIIEKLSTDSKEYQKLKCLITFLKRVSGESNAQTISPPSVELSAQLNSSTRSNTNNGSTLTESVPLESNATLSLTASAGDPKIRCSTSSRTKTNPDNFFKQFNLCKATMFDGTPVPSASSGNGAHTAKPASKLVPSGLTKSVPTEAGSTEQRAVVAGTDSRDQNLQVNSKLVPAGGGTDLTAILLRGPVEPLEQETSAPEGTCLQAIDEGDDEDKLSVLAAAGMQFMKTWIFELWTKDRYGIPIK